MSKLQDQTLALASMFQSATLINQLAEGESINQAAFDCSLDSIFSLDAQSTEEIYGYGEGLIQGLKTLVGYLGSGQQTIDKRIAYYVLSMLKLQDRLLRDHEMVDEIQTGLHNIQSHTEEFELSQQAKIHKIDGLYQQTLSQIKPRIIVQGDQLQLSNSEVTSKVRSLLFAGIRAAVLWKQRGGSRLKLVFFRKRYVQQAEQLLDKF